MKALQTAAVALAFVHCAHPTTTVAAPGPVAVAAPVPAITAPVASASAAPSGAPRDAEPAMVGASTAETRIERWKAQLSEGQQVIDEKSVGAFHYAAAAATDDGSVNRGILATDRGEVRAAVSWSMLLREAAGADLVAVDDIDGDGRPDVVVTMHGEPLATSTLYLDKEDGPKEVWSTDGPGTVAATKYRGRPALLVQSVDTAEATDTYFYVYWDGKSFQRSPAPRPPRRPSPPRRTK